MKAVESKSCGVLGRTFTDFQINGVVDILAQFLAASGFFKHEALQMEHQHGGQLFQRHPSTDLNLNPQRNKHTGDMKSGNTLWGRAALENVPEPAQCRKEAGSKLH